MKVLICCLFISILFHGVVIYFFSQSKTKTLYPVEIKFGVVEVTKSVVRGTGASKLRFDETKKISTAPSSVVTVADDRGAELASNPSSVGEESLFIDIKTSYPEMSRMRGEEEEIMVQVHIDKSGKVEKILFVSEPKYPRLKKAVLTAISETNFDHIKSIAKLKFNFKLK